MMSQEWREFLKTLKSIDRSLVQIASALKINDKLKGENNEQK